jgi:hypothetical protein
MIQQNRAPADRVRKSLSVPSSLMGGETFVLNSMDVRDLLEEHDRLVAENERLRAELGSLGVLVRDRPISCP